MLLKWSNSIERVNNYLISINCEQLRLWLPYLIDSNKTCIHFNRCLLIACSACMLIGSISNFFRTLIPCISSLTSLFLVMFATRKTETTTTTDYNRNNWIRNGFLLFSINWNFPSFDLRQTKIGDSHFERIFWHPYGKPCKSGIWTIFDDNWCIWWALCFGAININGATGCWHLFYIHHTQSTYTYI